MAKSTDSQNPETVASKTGESRNRQQAQGDVDKIAALLRGENDDQDGESANINQSADDDQADESEPSGERRKPKGKPKDLDELAERLGVKVADLYDLQLKMGGDGESRTLGQLKDIAADQDKFTVDKLEFEERKTKGEQEFLRSAQELNELIGMLPKSAIKPELIRAVQEKRAAQVAKEERETLRVIPEWNDDQVETKDRAEMQEHMAAYGFPKNYLTNIVDHRTLKYIRDNMRRQQRIEHALAQVRTVRKPGHKPSAKPSQPSSNANGSAKRRPNVASQIEQVAALLQSG